MTTGWKKTAAGYELETKIGTAVMAKAGKTWKLTVGDSVIDLGRRASFDHAEGALLELDAV